MKILQKSLFVNVRMGSSYTSVITFTVEKVSRMSIFVLYSQRLGQTFPQAYFTQFHTWDRKIIWNITATSHQRYYKQKQPPRGVPWDRCSKNMNLQENTHAELRFQNHTLAWVFSCKFTAYFQNFFS